MAYQNSTVPFEKMLNEICVRRGFMQAMVKRLCERLMEAEIESKLCAEKPERSSERQDYGKKKILVLITILNRKPSRMNTCNLFTKYFLRSEKAFAANLQRLFPILQILNPARLFVGFKHYVSSNC